jgi:hypothetical protein
MSRKASSHLEAVADRDPFGKAWTLDHPDENGERSLCHRISRVCPPHFAGMALVLRKSRQNLRVFRFGNPRLCTNRKGWATRPSLEKHEGWGNQRKSTSNLTVFRFENPPLPQTAKGWATRLWATCRRDAKMLIRVQLQQETLLVI